MQCLNLRLTRENLSRPWGFRLQGGVDTASPLSVQRVFSASPAEGVLKKGDIIKILENKEAQDLTNKDVQDILRISEHEVTCTVERNSNEQNNHDLVNDVEPPMSVKLARKKFINTDNSSPRPFGDFGTHYNKKDDSIPTSDLLEMQHECTPDQYHNTKQKEEDEKIDYSFMTLPVNERKKLFAGPNGYNISQTLPRQRSYSFRPPQRAYEVTTKVADCQPYFGEQSFNRRRGNEKMTNSRTANSSLYSVPLEIKADMTSHSSKAIHQIDNERNSRHSSSTQIIQCRPNQTQSTSHWNNDSHDANQRVTAHIYRCGSANNRSTSMQRSTNQQLLSVKTYPIQSMDRSNSPSTLRPAYPVCNVGDNFGDQWSTISIRSEPHYQSHERHLIIERPAIFRSCQDPVSSNTHLNMLQIEEPCTRITAAPRSNSQSQFWNTSNLSRMSMEPVAQSFTVRANHVSSHYPSIRREIKVPNSQSNLIIHQTRKSKYDVSSSASGPYQQRNHLDFASDF